ncbi:MAG TPA: PIG-L family deacetylase, partial [Pseudonocardia sp.]|nr:PIG-L family deacetylase [Pseudonocardia sp.]
MSIPTDDQERTYPEHRNITVPDARGMDVAVCGSRPAAVWKNGTLTDPDPDPDPGADPYPGAVARLRLGLTRDVVVVAAHLDEELAGAGGLLTSLVTAGAELRVLALTDGDCDEAGGYAP